MRSREGLETDEEGLSVQHVLRVGLLNSYAARILGGRLPLHDLSFSLFHPWRAGK
jgi:hypothetical protein